MNTICKNGITIYPNKTSCTDLIYVTKEEIKSEETKTLPTILIIALILCLVGTLSFIYKKFLKKEK